MIEHRWFRGRLNFWLAGSMTVALGMAAGWSGPAALAQSPLAAELGPNRADEPLAKEFGWDSAARFLDAAAVQWTREHQCFTCHTNFSYLLARPLVNRELNQPVGEAEREVRTALEAMVTRRWSKEGPRWDAEVVMSAVVLAMHDARTTGKLGEATRVALGRMWTVQREDGGFNWLKCDWPPMESDDHFGATMALVGVAAAPEGYAQSEEARRGLVKLREYLRANPPPTLHHRLMTLWGSLGLEGILDADAGAAIVRDVAALQRPDGGWALASLGDWQRGDGQPQDVATSDGYATGLVVYVLLQQGVSVEDARIARGVNWLRSNQRESGRWFTRSLHLDGPHYISHAGTAFAVMALHEAATRRLAK